MKKCSVPHDNSVYVRYPEDCMCTCTVDTSPTQFPMLVFQCPHPDIPVGILTADYHVSKLGILITRIELHCTS